MWAAEADKLYRGGLRQGEKDDYINIDGGQEPAAMHTRLGSWAAETKRHRPNYTPTRATKISKCGGPWRGCPGQSTVEGEGK